jgi:hypothetical protein
MTISAVLVLILAVIAGIVSAMQWVNGQRNKSIMWAFIVAYWVVLTIKNVCDLAGW